MPVTVTDFSRSFVRWSVLVDPDDTRTPGHMPWGNSVRIALDARCTILDPDGSAAEFYLIAPCRKEWMYQKTGLIMDPGAEYRAIFSIDRQIDVSMQARIEGDRSLPETTEGFQELAFEISTHPAEPLESDADVAAAARSRRPLVARTRIDHHSSGIRALLEYPVKTMNYHPDRKRFQVDTGPLIFPDLDAQVDHPIECCRLAHTIYNTFDYAEFTCRPASQNVVLSAGGTGFRAYSELRRVNVEHELFAFSCALS